MITTDADLHELTNLTLDWLDLHHPGEFECTENVRNQGDLRYRNFDRIISKQHYTLGTFINIMADAAVFFTPAQMRSDFEILAADPDYFKKVEEFVEVWHVYAKTNVS